MDLHRAKYKSFPDHPFPMATWAIVRAPRRNSPVAFHHHTHSAQTADSVPAPTSIVRVPCGPLAPDQIPVVEIQRLWEESELQGPAASATWHGLCEIDYRTLSRLARQQLVAKRRERAAAADTTRRLLATEAGRVP